MQQELSCVLIQPSHHPVRGLGISQLHLILVIIQLEVWASATFISLLVVPFQVCSQGACLSTAMSHVQTWGIL